MNRQQMAKKMDAITNLPTLPAVAMEVNRMLQDVDSPIEKLMGVIEKDQSMVLKILRLVNSSFYGFKSKISSLRHAITLVGYSTVQNAVVTVAVIDCLKSRNSLNGFDISKFWTHSIRVAVLSRHLAASSSLAEPDSAFTAGLVHDIGKVVLANHFPDVFVNLYETMIRDEITFYAAEKSVDYFPHNRIGSKLARHWLLPEPLERSIRHHHGNAENGQTDRLAGLVAVADTLVNVMDHLAGYRLVIENLPLAVRTPITEILKDSARWFPEIKKDMASACEFFNKG